MLDRVIILIAVVLTGFSTLAAQVILPRTLHPYFGSTGNVGAAVVTLSLAGLALGYVVGGRAGGNAKLRMAGALLVGAAALLCTALIWPHLGDVAGDVGTVRLLLTAAAVAFLPSIFLGMVSPLAVRALEQRRPDHPSERPALVFGFGTVANVVGGLVAGYWLVPFVGLTRSLTSLSVLLALTGVGMVAYQRFGPSPVATSESEVEDIEEVSVDASIADGPDSASGEHHGQSDDAAATSGSTLGSAPGAMSGSLWGLVALAFYSGVASLAIEVSGTRMLASNFGPTTTLWASVLSVSLGGLAVGYLVGGNFRYESMRSALAGVIAVNSIWLLVSAWLMAAFSQSSPTNSFGVILTITSVAFFPTFVMFGIESQLVVGLVTGSLTKGADRSEETPGMLSSDAVATITGRVFAASTVGGLLGALSGVFFLLPVLGISTFVRIAAAGYLIMGAITLDRRRASLALLAVLAAVGPLPNWVWRGENGVLLTQREGRHQTIRVYTDEVSYLRFHLGPTYESEVDYTTRLPRFGYARTILSQVGDVTGSNVLVIGGAGHALARAFEARGATVTEVEVDPLVAETSDEFFGPIEGDVIIDDGRHFVTNAPSNTYDIVIIDAFDGPRVVPPHITTVEFYEEISRVLNADGRMYINMIGQVTGEGNGSFNAMSSTVASVFPASARDGASGNIVLFAGNSSVPDGLEPLSVLVDPNTDDLNPMEIMTNRSS